MTIMRPKRARRCQLAVPASNQRAITKAASLGVDHVFLDLEDAVAPREKVAARANVIRAFREMDWGHTVRCFRINDLETQWAYEDVISVVEACAGAVDTVMLPKVRRPADVQWLDVLLGQIERKIGLERKIGIEILIEEVEAMQDIDAIAGSSSRLEAMILGMGDFTAAQGINVASVGEMGGYPSDLWHYARVRMIIACRANGLDPIDGPFADFRKHEVYNEEARKAYLLGAVGKWAIHPDQIPLAVAAFSPAADAVADARRYAKAYHDAVEAGQGAISVDGQLIDAASMRMYRKTLAQAELYRL
ncbi:CoA ester lyase [Bradyrhizobium sp. 14AA]